MVSDIPTMRSLSASLILTCLLLADPVISIQPLVQTTSGPVQGTRETGFHRLLDTFLGIPYAEPPEGDLRFRRPEPVQPWTYTLVANRLPPSCYPDVSFAFVNQASHDFSEDCLYLNIWAPYMRSQQRLPSLVWIQSDYSLMEDGQQDIDVSNGQYLATENDVIVVRINSRLGEFGYLYAGNERAPGNMGLLDQAMALKWVYNNIEKFGGDKTKITLVGDKEGADYVSLHLLSPISRTYFTNAILERGTAFGPNSYATPEEAMIFTQGFAYRVGCSDEDVEKIMDCLNSTETDELLTYSGVVNRERISLSGRPTLDGYFLEDSPRNLIEKGQIKNANIIIGVSSLEKSDQFIRSNDHYFIKKQSNLTAEEYLAQAVEGLVPVNSEITRYGIIHEYKMSVIPSRRQGTRDILDNIATDYNILCPSMDFAHKYATLADEESVFVFSYDHRSPDTYRIDRQIPRIVQLAFGMPLRSRNYTDDEKILSANIMRFWTNFAKTGNPNKENRFDRRTEVWPAYTITDREYISLTTGHSYNTGQGMRYERCSFWKDLYPKLNGVEDPVCASSYKPVVSLIVLLAAALFHVFH